VLDTFFETYTYKYKKVQKNMDGREGANLEEGHEVWNKN